MPVPPHRLNTIRLARHETKVVDLELKDDNGRPVKLTDAEIALTVSDDVGEEPLISKSIGGGIEVTDQAAGKASVTLTSADTAGLEAGEYKYDAWVSYSGDPPKRLRVIRSALFIVEQSVTPFD